MKNLKLAISQLTDNVYIIGSNPENKADVTNDFLHTVIQRWNGYEETITVSNGKKYKVSVNEIK
ncbi:MULTISPECIES: DUF7446 family protein [Bacillus]|uniref:DUF7446 family protein n=1 Tax=Bacillus TaxID=1386 RepID=UPI00090A4094|nr:MULTISPECIES: hypothetical protein [Bacillus]APJ11138.1 hypothetical protein BSL056_09270 [Bacillus safensis]MBS4747420.1 hypothetical protein [Bacillus altitudinis]MBS4749431.1 hypothetical protein [Bacillus altitudinis]